MKPIGTHNYYIYISTNVNKTVLYIGVTNDLQRRLYKHKEDALNSKKHFTGKYNVYSLIYWEHFDNIEDAIKREKTVKRMDKTKERRVDSDFKS